MGWMIASTGILGIRDPLSHSVVCMVTYMIYRHPTSITMHGVAACVGSRLLQAIGLAKRLLVVYTYTVQATKLHLPALLCYTRLYTELQLTLHPLWGSTGWL